MSHSKHWHESYWREEKETNTMANSSGITKHCSFYSSCPLNSEGNTEISEVMTVERSLCTKQWAKCLIHSSLLHPHSDPLSKEALSPIFQMKKWRPWNSHHLAHGFGPITRIVMEAVYGVMLAAVEFWWPNILVQGTLRHWTNKCYAGLILACTCTLPGEL